jgi:hypothetical protein
MRRGDAPLRPPPPWMGNIRDYPARLVTESTRAGAEKGDDGFRWTFSVG